MNRREEIEAGAAAAFEWDQVNDGAAEWDAQPAGVKKWYREIVSVAFEAARSVSLPEPPKGHNE